MGRTTNTCRSKNILLKDEWVNKEIKDYLKYLEGNEKENMTIQNLWAAAKAVLRGKYKVVQALLKKKEANKQTKYTK